jgi:transposase
MPATLDATISTRSTPRERALERRVAELESENAALGTALSDLQKRFAELEARLKENSANSHRPPSSDPPWNQPPQRKREPSGRKRGAQPGHEGATRELVPVELVAVVVPVFPKACRRCAASLTPRAVVGTPGRHQVVEVPPRNPHVTEYQLHAARCRCGAVTCAALPAEARCSFGPRLQATVALLTGRFRLSRREAVDALKALFGVDLSLGSITKLEQATSDALKAPYHEALAAIREAEVVHSDETSWRNANMRAWLWIAVTTSLAVFRIDARRNREAFLRLLGGFVGVLVTDRWGAYVRHARTRHQLCWAHLKRDFEKLVLRGGDAAKLGNALLAEIKVIFELWHMFRRGEISRATLHRRMVPVKSRVRALLVEGKGNSHKKARGLCARLLPVWTCLWIFLRVPGVEPTNNVGERDLRKAVLWRKGSFGSQRTAGCLYVSRILTTVGSLRKQHRDVLDFLEAAVRAHRAGGPAPSLLVA